MKTTAIKFFWNGIKINGENKLIRCFYSIDNHVGYDKCVSISARDYANLPGDVFAVTNETDIMTDYFDSDGTVLTPDHPLYKYARYAAIKAYLRDAEKYYEKLRDDFENDRVRETWPGRVEGLRKDMEARGKKIAEYKAEIATNPGHPTAEDLAEIEAMRLAAETARLAAEHEEELRRREEVLRERNEGRRYIEDVAKEWPIKDGEPVVTIEWSEHPAFYSWDDGELKLSVAAAEIILGHYDDEKAKEDGGYFKTKFIINWTDANGEPSTYEGRYDLGDGEGGLIALIRNLATWELTHDIFGHVKETPDETNDRLEFANALDRYTARGRMYAELDEIMKDRARKSYEVSGNIIRVKFGA